MRQRDQVVEYAPISGAADETLAVAGSAVVFTAAIDNRMMAGLVSVGANPVRVRWGANPTSSVGHYLPAGSQHLWQRATIAGARFIQVSSASDVALTQLG